MVTCIVLLLQVWGVLENAWAVFTAVFAMVAIGFVAIWSVLSNSLCALFLLVTKPFRVGDKIQIVGDAFSGKVVDFNLLFTTLREEGSEGASIQIPNNIFFQRMIRRIHGEAKIELEGQLLETKEADV